MCQTSDAEYIADQARAHFRQGEFQLALEKFSECSTMGDQAFKTLILNNIALCNLRLGRNHEAAEAARKVIDAEPANFKAHFRLASALKDSDDVMTALQHIMLPAGNMQQNRQED